MAPRDNGTEPETPEEKAARRAKRKAGLRAKLNGMSEEEYELRERLGALPKEERGPLDKREATAERTKFQDDNLTIKEQKKELGMGTLELHPNDPMWWAQTFVDLQFTKSGARTLHRHRDVFWKWTGSYFRRTSDEVVQSIIWKFLDQTKRIAKVDGEDKLTRFKPNQTHVSNAFKALTSVAQLDEDVGPPAWIDGAECFAPEAFLSCGNGLLHLPTGELFPQSPAFFCLAATTVKFDKAAPTPTRWLAFLEELWPEPDGKQSIELLQEWFGYTLLPDTSQQKILLMVGPTRGGKGTIARVLKGLLGEDSVAGPSMSSLGGPFGLEALITKPLAIIPDARVGGKTDKTEITERLLSISGEDQMSVGRKFLPAWHGQMMTRLMILTNEFPSLSDGSGALAGRYLLLQLTKTFYGQEDHGLAAALMKELPAILNWAIKGYERLKERGKFVQPKASLEAVEEIGMLGAPVKAFVRDYCCEMGPGLEVFADDLWKVYCTWRIEQGSRDSGSKAWFGRSLNSAVPGLKQKRGRDGADRRLVYVGLGLTAEWYKDGELNISKLKQHHI